eukprot:scaffold68234_cov26-Tisochrysis_lutea.AAC.1
MADAVMSKGEWAGALLWQSSWRGGSDWSGSGLEECGVLQQAAGSGGSTLQREERTIAAREWL